MPRGSEASSVVHHRRAATSGPMASIPQERQHVQGLHGDRRPPAARGVRRPQARVVAAVGGLPAAALRGHGRARGDGAPGPAGPAAADRLRADAAAGRPDRRGHEQPARGRGRAAGAGPLLPLADLGDGAAALPGNGRLRVVGRHARAVVVGGAHARLRGRRRLGAGHQHRPRAGAQAHGPRAMARAAGAGRAGLRPLHGRTRARPPSLRVHARGPRQLPHGREHLPLRAARVAGRRAPGLAAGEGAARRTAAAGVERAQHDAAELRGDGAAAAGPGRGIRLDHAALPGGAQRGGLVAADVRQLRGALRAAAPARRQRPLRSAQAAPLVEHQPPGHQPGDVPPAAALRPPRLPVPPLPVAAPLRGPAAAAQRLLRHVHALLRARAVVQGDGPAAAGAAAGAWRPGAGERGSAAAWPASPTRP